MDQDMIATHFENLDRRLAKVEQILPTLATKEDLSELRRHMDILNESLREDIHFIAAHVASAQPKRTEPASPETPGQP